MTTNKTRLLAEVFDQTRRLFHLLSTAAEHAHADLGLNASERAVLEALSRSGPLPVPEIARGKGVSRQHIQSIANGLLDKALIERRPNPAHQRSPLLTLTEEGASCFRTVERREAQILEALARSLRAADLELTTRTMRAVGELLERTNEREGEPDDE